MGDAGTGPFRSRSIHNFASSSGEPPQSGLLLPRELDEDLGLSALIERHLSNPG